MAVKIFVCGDFRAANPDIIHFEESLASELATGDIKVCNFEAPVKTTGAKPSVKSGPGLDQSVKSPAILKKFGFNVIQLANNHIMDYGKEGLKATLEEFEGVITVGAGSAKDAYSPRFMEIKGKCIGFLSYVHHEFGVVDYVDDGCYGAAWISSLDVPEIVMNTKKKCDFLVVLPHAGIEHEVAPLPVWRKMYRKFIDWGADCVIGGHTHCPQGWETYKGKPIYYSLGDFYFDELSYDDLWYKSIITEIVIDDEAVCFKEHFVSFDDKTGLISYDSSERISNYISYANHLIHNQEEYDRHIDKLCAACYPSFKYILSRGICAVTFKLPLKKIIRLLGCMLLGKQDDLTLLNLFQCESHRWAREKMLTIINKIHITE